MEPPIQTEYLRSGGAMICRSRWERRAISTLGQGLGFHQGPALVGLAEVSGTWGTVWAVRRPTLTLTQGGVNGIWIWRFFNEHICFSGFLYAIYFEAFVTPLPHSVCCCANRQLAPNPVRPPRKGPDDGFDCRELCLRTQHGTLYTETTTRPFGETLDRAKRTVPGSPT